MTITMFEVGGCVRDGLLGLRTKDIDFSVELPDFIGRPAHEGFDFLLAHLQSEGFEVFDEKPEFVTVRAQFPKGHPQRGQTTADFVLCRRDGTYTDGRRPDSVTVGTLSDDLARRDFTVNAMARKLDGELIDPHGGMVDLDARLLRCVGDVFERMTEDPLRALRAVRFAVTKGFGMADDLREFLGSAVCRIKLSQIALERREQELHLAFAHDTIGTLDLMHSLHPRFAEAALAGIWLVPTHKKAK